MDTHIHACARANVIADGQVLSFSGSAMFSPKKKRNKEERSCVLLQLYLPSVSCPLPPPVSSLCLIRF